MCIFLFLSLMYSLSISNPEKELVLSKGRSICPLHQGKVLTADRQVRNGKVLPESTESFAIYKDSLYDQTWARTAWGTDFFFVVWKDESTYHSDIKGRMVDGLGNVQPETVGVFVSSNIFSELPAVDFDGTNFLVVWDDSRNMPIDTNSVFGVRINENGKRVGNEIEIARTPAREGKARVAWNGKDAYLIVWVEGATSGNGNIKARIVDSTGKVVGDIIDIASTSLDEDNPKVVSNGSQWLVVWDEGVIWVWENDIKGKLVANDGTVGQEITICNADSAQYRPSVASDGGKFLVIWYDRRNNSTTGDDIYGQVVDSSGKLEGGNFPIIQEVDDQQFPSVVWNGIQYFVVSEDWASRKILARAVESNGNLMGELITIPPSPGSAFFPEVAWNGDKHLIVWTDLSEKYDVWGNISQSQVVGVNEIGSIAESKIMDILPNPFVDRVEIRYMVPEDTYLSLNVYDMSGRLVKSLYDGYKASGNYKIVWDSKVKSGVYPRPSLMGGIYFVKLIIGTKSYTKKVILI